MQALEESWQAFQEDTCLVEVFASACLSIACKFGQSLDKSQIRILRGSAKLENFLAMEISILDVFDWCLDHIASPTLSGMLDVAGFTKEMTEVHFFTIYVQPGFCHAFVPCQCAARLFFSQYPCMQNRMRNVHCTKPSWRFTRTQL